ncbi:hypothetical protein PR048_019155 [Dryococelus australis]|uniref:BESS domain-containing protein n=1 Tax=Dryococelus australis TaxID=614101 RepID=A0ABQ9H2U1_9NEOP|nr:hypothetical protein PR048_019155 [Dryococelus australis]
MAKNQAILDGGGGGLECLQTICNHDRASSEHGGRGGEQMLNVCHPRIRATSAPGSCRTDNQLIELKFPVWKGQLRLEMGSKKAVQCWDMEFGCAQPARSVYLILSLQRGLVYSLPITGIFNNRCRLATGTGGAPSGDGGRNRVRGIRAGTLQMTVQTHIQSTTVGEKNKCFESTSPPNVFAKYPVALLSRTYGRAGMTGAALGAANHHLCERSGRTRHADTTDTPGYDRSGGLPSIVSRGQLPPRQMWGYIRGVPHTHTHARTPGACKCSPCALPPPLTPLTQDVHFGYFGTESTDHSAQYWNQVEHSSAAFSSDSDSTIDIELKECENILSICNNNVTCSLSIASMLHRLNLLRLPDLLHVSSFSQKYSLQPRRRIIPPLLITLAPCGQEAYFPNLSCQQSKIGLKEIGIGLPLLPNLLSTVSMVVGLTALLEKPSLERRIDKVMIPVAMLILHKEEGYEMCIEVDLKQGFQKCSFYREQPISSHTHTPSKVIEVSTEQRRNAGAGETEDHQENPPANGIVRHDSHMPNIRKYPEKTQPAIGTVRHYAEISADFVVATEYRLHRTRQQNGVTNQRYVETAFGNQRQAIPLPAAGRLADWGSFEEEEEVLKRAAACDESGPHACVVIGRHGSAETTSTRRHAPRFLWTYSEEEQCQSGKNYPRRQKTSRKSSNQVSKITGLPFQRTINLCTNMPISTAHWLPTVTVEGDDWASLLHEVSNTVCINGSLTINTPAHWTTATMVAATNVLHYAICNRAYYATTTSCYVQLNATPQLVARPGTGRAHCACVQVAMEDIERLITEIKSRPAIWDLSSDSYCDRNFNCLPANGLIILSLKENASSATMTCGIGVDVVCEIGVSSGILRSSDSSRLKNSVCCKMLESPYLPHAPRDNTQEDDIDGPYSLQDRCPEKNKKIKKSEERERERDYIGKELVEVLKTRRASSQLNGAGMFLLSLRKEIDKIPEDLQLQTRMKILDVIYGSQQQSWYRMHNVDPSNRNYFTQPQASNSRTLFSTNNLQQHAQSGPSNRFKPATTCTVLTTQQLKPSTTCTVWTTQQL